MLEHCNRLLAGYKRPQSVDFVDAAAQGVDRQDPRRELRDRVLGGPWRVVSDPVVVLGAARTPFGGFGGAIARPVDPDFGSGRRRGGDGTRRRRPGRRRRVRHGRQPARGDRSIARQTALHAGIPDDARRLHRRPRLLLVADRASRIARARRAERRRQRSPSPVAARTSAGCRTSSRGSASGGGPGDVVLDDQLDDQLPLHRGATRAVQAPTRRSGTASSRRAPGRVGAAQPPAGCRRPSGRGCSTTRSRRSSADAGSARCSIATSRSAPARRSRPAGSSWPPSTADATVTAGNAPGLSTAAPSFVLASRPRSRAAARRATGGRRGAVGRTGRRAPGEDRLDPGGRRPRRAGAGRPRARRHRPDRDQRGVRRGRPRGDRRARRR